MTENRRTKFNRFISVILLAAVLVIPVFGFGYSKSEDPDIPVELLATSLARDIYIDGKLIDNWALERPIIIMDGANYAPVDDNGELDLRLAEEPKDLANFKVTAGYHLTINGENATLRDVLVLEDGSEYYSLNFLKRLGKVDASYSPVGGLYLSTDEKIKADEYKENNPNTSYIEGRCAYMMRMNKNLEKGEALDLEYLIRHAAKTHNLDVNLVTSVARIESNFNAKVGTRTIGLMQIMLKYANSCGYTYESILDPHNNLDYGCGILEDGIKKFGNLTTALCAYNSGTYSVLAKLEAGELNTIYAEKVLSSQRAMIYWIKQKGYSNEMIEYIGK